MKDKKCNCKKCAKLDYMQKGMYFGGLVDKVYCDKFPKGEAQPFCCKDYVKEVNYGRENRS